MDLSRKRQYLKALEIDAWSRRDPQAAQETQAAGAVPPRPAIPEETVAIAASPVQAQAPAEIALPVGAERPVPRDWPGLKAAVSGCTHCKLCRTRTNTVFAAGNESAPLMVIGEGPGADEDAQGFPFVGRAGKLLDEMLRAIGRSRTESAPERAVYIANVVKCRPPGNRDPEPDEVSACRPYLDQQLRLVKPRLIVALGRVAAQRLLATDAPLSKLRGPLYEYGEAHTPVLITYHPAYLLRSPGEKAKSWVDLKRVQRLLAEPDQRGG